MTHIARYDYFAKLFLLLFPLFYVFERYPQVSAVSEGLRATLRARLRRSETTIHRFEFDSKHYKSPSGTFNPAATFDSNHGWILICRWDACFYKECGILGTGTQVWHSVLRALQ